MGSPYTGKNLDMNTTTGSLMAYKWLIDGNLGGDR
jgi:hypothetical protein